MLFVEHDMETCQDLVAIFDLRCCAALFAVESNEWVKEHSDPNMLGQKRDLQAREGANMNEQCIHDMMAWHSIKRCGVVCVHMTLPGRAWQF